MSALPEEAVLFPESLLAAAAHPDPYPYYAALLAYRPLYRDHGLGLWVALGADAVGRILSSEAARVRPAGEPVPGAIAGAPAGGIFGNLVRMNDGARHAKAKAAIAASLASVDGTQAVATARHEAAVLAKSVSFRRGSSLDAFTFALPVRVVARMIGLPQDLAARCAGLIGDFVRCLSPLSGPDEIAGSNAAAAALLQVLREEWRRNARGGLAVQAERLRDLGLGETDAVLANLVGLMSQTYEATAGLIGNTLLALARHPQMRRRAAGDDPLLQRVIAEVARHDPPVHNTRRFLAEDCIVAGERMKAGEQILVVLAAANRDPAHCDRPHIFDPERTDVGSFTFGTGRHACAGQSIAAMITAAAIQVLTAHGLDIASLDGAVVYRPSINSRVPLFGGIP